MYNFNFVHIIVVLYMLAICGVHHVHFNNGSCTNATAISTGEQKVRRQRVAIDESKVGWQELASSAPKVNWQGLVRVETLCIQAKSQDGSGSDSTSCTKDEYFWQEPAIPAEAEICEQTEFWHSYIQSTIALVHYALVPLMLWIILLLSSWVHHLRESVRKLQDRVDLNHDNTRKRVDTIALQVHNFTSNASSMREDLELIKLLSLGNGDIARSNRTRLDAIEPAITTMQATQTLHHTRINGLLDGEADDQDLDAPLAPCGAYLSKIRTASRESREASPRPAKKQRGLSSDH